MSSYTGFLVLIDEHQQDEALEFIRELGFELVRTNRVGGLVSAHQDGWQIVNTDITIWDPVPDVRYGGRETVAFFLPKKGTGDVKHDHEADKKLMSKLKRRFAIKPKK